MAPRDVGEDDGAIVVVGESDGENEGCELVEGESDGGVVGA